MLQRKIFLFLTTLISFSILSISFFFKESTYQAYVWPYILIFLGFHFLRHFFFVYGAFLETQRCYRIDRGLKGERAEFTPRVSIIVPAYNEAKVIVNSLSHLSHLNYPNYEIIMVDDGSQDDTYHLAQTVAAQYSHSEIMVLRKENAGKAAALNFGFLQASGELILGVDADSRLHPDSLYYGVQHFRDARVGAVAGYIEIENPRNLLEECQQLEYMVSLNFVRKAYSYLGAIPIIPGPAGLFRRKTLEEIKGLTNDPSIFAEDAEMSLRIVSSGWYVRSEERMLAYTEAPADIKSFFKQRYRWNRGTFQALSKNFMGMMTSSSHMARFLALHMYIEIWLLPLFNALLVFNFVSRLFLYQEIHYFTVWIAFGVFLDYWMLMAATMNRKKLLWGMLIMVFFKLFYDYLLFFWKIMSYFDEWRGEKMSWNKLKRKPNTKGVTYG